MSSRPGCAARRGLLALCLLAAGPVCEAQQTVDGRRPGDPPVIRRIYVPAAAPARWPAGPWEPMPLEEFERRLAALRENAPQAQADGLERAEYRARLVGDELQAGRLEWVPRGAGAAPRFLSLTPQGLALSRLESLDGATGSPLGAAIWGTAPGGDAGVLLEPPAVRLAGEWSLRGRRLARSVEFDLRLPPATISRMTLHVPEDLALSASAGDLTGPHPTAEAGWRTWELHLGSLGGCRLRAGPPAIASAPRPLLVARARTNYVVRPEAVRVLAEFDPEMWEGAIRELRLTVGEGLRITDVEYGEEGDVAWNVVAEGNGRDIRVELPDPLAGPGQILRVRGIASLDPRSTWVVPTIRVQGAIEPEAFVTVRMQPPFQAADLRFDGYRQIDMTAGAADGETAVFRRSKPAASLSIAPADARLAPVCRSIAIAALLGDEWTLSGRLEMRTSAGTAFEISCRVPADWEIVNVQREGPEGPYDPAAWEIETDAAGVKLLRVSLSTALEPNLPLRLRIAARRAAAPAGEPFPIPVFVCPGVPDIEATTILYSDPEHRPLVRDSAGFEQLPLADLPPVGMVEEILNELPDDAGPGSTVVRTTLSDAAGSLALRPLHVPGAPAAAAEPPATQANSGAVLRGGPDRAVVPLSVACEIHLDAADRGYDVYHATIPLLGPEGSEFQWRLSSRSELIAAKLEGRAVVPQSVGNRHMVRLPPGGGPPQTLVFEYRTPARRAFGPNRARLDLPQFVANAPLACRVTLRVPERLRLQTGSEGMRLAPEQAPGDSALGPLARNDDEQLFNPLRAADWRSLARRISGGERSPTQSGAGGTDDRLWNGTSLHVPAQIEVVIWDRAAASSLAWIAVWSSLLAAIAFRMWPSRATRLLAASTFAGLIGAVCALPPIQVEIAGSALVGLAIGLLLPQSALRWTATRSRSVPSRSTGSTQSLVRASVLGAVLLVPLTYAVRAQDSSGGQPVASGPRPGEVADVLIPVGSDGKPVGAGPLCYVPPGLLSRLETHPFAARIPRYLISSARCRAKLVGSRQIDVSVGFDICVLSTDEIVAVALPLTNAVPAASDACLVDGRPHPLLLSRDGRNLIVELEGRSVRPPAVPGPSPEASEPTGAVRRLASTVTPRRVELRVHLPVETDADGACLARLGIPAVHDTTVEFSTEGEAVFRPAASVAGETSLVSGAGAPAGRTSAAVGAVHELQFHWSTEMPVESAGARIEASVSGLVDVSPALASTSYQVGYRVLSGSIDALVWLLPPQAVVRSVQAPGLRSWAIEPDGQGARRLFLEFAAPQSGSFVVSAALMQPLSAASELPLLDLGGLSSGSVQTVLRRFQIAFRPPPDVRLTATPTSPDATFKPRPVDEFLREWPVVAGRPQQAFETLRPTSLRLTLQDLQSPQTGRTESRGRFSRNRLGWVFTAEVDRQAIPPFQYRVQVDPRLRIENASVQEDGAERLHRWSQVGDTLVLFLDDRAARSQTVRIEAALPLALPQDLELPRCRVEGMEVTAERVLLTCDPDVRLIFAGEEAHHPALPGPEGNAREHPLVRWELTSVSSLPHVRVEAAAPSITAQNAFLLLRSDAGRELTAAVEFRVQSGRALRFDIEVPDDFANRAEIETTPPSQIVRLPAADGRSTLAFFPAEAVSGSFEVRLRVLADLPGGFDWTVPSLLLPGVPVEAAYLILPREQPVALPAVSPPEWLATMIELETNLVRASCTRLPLDGTPVVVHLVDVTRDGSAQTLADVRVELDDDGALFGRLLLWLPERPPAALVFDWPAGAVPRTVFVDDRPQAISAPVDGTWTLPLPAGPAPRLVWISWSDGSTSRPGVVGRFRPLLPALRNLPLATELMTERTPSRWFTWGSRNGQPQALRDIAIDRWQAALSACERTAPHAAAASDRWIIPYLSGAAREAERLAAIGPNPPEREIASLEQRMDDLKSLRGEATAPDPFGQAIADATGFGDSRADSELTHRHIRSATPPPPSGPIEAEAVTFVDRRLLRIVGGALLALLVGVLAVKAAWLLPLLQGRNTLAWGLLSVGWWLLLQPSALGVFLLAGTLVHAWRSSRRGQQPLSEAVTG